MLCASTLVLPDSTLSASGPLYTPAQMAFASAASSELCGAFLFVQTVRHRDYRDYFLPTTGAKADEDAHAAPPTGR